MAFTHNWATEISATPVDTHDVGTPGGEVGGASRIRDTRVAISERMCVLMPDTLSNWDTQGYKMGVATWTTQQSAVSNVETIGCSAAFVTSQTLVLLYELTAYASNAAASAAELYAYFNIDGTSTDARYMLIPSGRADSLCIRYVDSGVAANTHSLKGMVGVESGSPAIRVRCQCLSVAPIWRNLV